LTEETPTTEPVAKPKKRRPIFGFWSMMFYVIFVPPVLAAAFIFMPGPLKEAATVIVPHGSHVYDIAVKLDETGITINPVMFRLAARLLAKDNLQAGEYEFTPHQSMASVIEEMHEGHSILRLFTAPEGRTSAEIVALLNDIPLTGTVPVPTEGTLLPESYRYTGGDTRASLITRMQKSMQETITAEWAKRDSVIPLKTPQEAVIMASIIEKETGKPEERARIARVFYNRLQQNMRLQSDPTVIYAITQGKGPLNRSLSHDDLALTNSAYNTYVSDGLPPGPICNPGRASIEAALHPEQNDFLYFVADGTGGHVFAKDLAEHNQNVAKWSQIRAQGGAVQQPATMAPQAH
jgi:UPF0755 protein